MNNHGEQHASQEFMDDNILMDDEFLDIMYMRDTKIIDDKYIFVNRFTKYLIDRKLFISKKKFIEVSITISNFEISDWFLKYYTDNILNSSLDGIGEFILNPTNIKNVLKNYINDELIDHSCLEIIETNLLRSIECINVESISECLKEVMLHKVKSYEKNIESINTLIDLYYKYRKNYYNDIIIDIY